LPESGGLSPRVFILQNLMKGRFKMKFSLIPLLLTGKSISVEARQALRENRLKDAAALIMKEYGLNCGEVSDLLSVGACD
jgi:hypothetical protein